MSASSKAGRKTRRTAAAPKPLKDRPRAMPRPSGIDHSQVRRTFTQLGFHTVRMAAQDGRFSHGGSGDMHLRFNRDQLANQAREFGRDNGLFQGIIDRATGYIVGTGFGLQVKTEDKDWNALAEAWWKQSFWDEPEVSGLLSGFQVEELVTKELLQMGDVGVLWTNLGKVQIVENEQIRGKSLQSDGLERDDNGGITGYWICPYSEAGHVECARARLVRRDNFLFLARPDRPSSKRAVPPLQAAFSMLHRINAVCDSEALAWQMLSRLALIVNKKDGGQTALQTSDEDEAKAGSDGPDVTTRVQDWDEGTSFWGEVGEEIKGVERNIPGANFSASLTMFLRLLGLPLGLPLEMVLLDWTKSNYSQSRAVLQQAFQMFIRWQMLLEKRFYRPLWRRAVDHGIKSGQLPAPKNDEQRHLHEWIKPTFPWIDQLQETKAWGEMVDRGFASFAQACKSRDQDVDEMRAALEDEALKAIEISDRIFTEKGVRVPWQYFAGKSASLNAVKDEASAGAAAEKPDAGDEEEDEEERKRAAAAAAPPINLIVKAAPRPIKTRTRVLAKDEHGKSTDIEQEHTYPPEVA